MKVRVNGSRFGEYLVVCSWFVVVYKKSCSKLLVTFRAQGAAASRD